MVLNVTTLTLAVLLFFETINALDDTEIILDGSLDKLSFDIVRKTGHFVYSICHSLPQNVTCHVTELQLNRTCTLEFEPRPKLNKYLFKSLTNDKVLMSFDVGEVMNGQFLAGNSNFVSYREEPLKIRILRVPDCSHKDISVPGAVSGLVVINDDESFDLVYATPDTVMLGQGTYRVRYNPEGKKILGTDAYVVFGLPPDQAVFTQPLLLDEAGSYLHEVSSALQHSLFRVSPNGEAHPIAADKDYLLSTSSAQGVLGVCWVNESDNVTCSQYDSAGRLRMKLNLKILDNSDSAFFVWQSPFNLEKKGMLVIGGFMAKISPENLNFKVTNFTIVKIRDGRYGKPEGIRELDFECSNEVSPYSSIVLTNVVVGKDDEFCLQFSCARYLSKASSALRFATKCVQFNSFN